MSAIDSPWSTPIIEATPSCNADADVTTLGVPSVHGASVTINFPTMA